MPLETAFRYLSVANCEEVEVAAMPRYLPRRGSVRRSLKRRGMKATTVSLGVPFFFSESRLSLNSPKRSVRDATVDYVRRSIDFASHIEAEMVYACSIERGPVQEHGQAIARLTQSVLECSDYAEDSGVRFGMEPFPTGELPTVTETSAFVKRAGSKNLGVLLDAGHASISGEPLGMSAQTSRGSLMHVHLNNNDGMGDLHWPPQRGKLTTPEFEALFLELREQGYGGRISIELSRPRPVVQTINRSREFVEGLIQRMFY